MFGSFDIRSQPRGPHWIAWIVRQDSDKRDKRDKPDKPGKPDKPDRAIVFVGATREDAEARARAFAENPASAT